MVRLVRDEDRGPVVVLAQAFLVAAGFPSEAAASAAEDKVTEVMVAVKEGHGIGLVLEHTVQMGELSYHLVVGFIGGVVGPHPVYGALTAFELAWYVDPAHRWGIGGAKLLRRFEKEGIARGARYSMMSALDDRVGGFLIRSGYTARETTYLKPFN